MRPAAGRVACALLVVVLLVSLAVVQYSARRRESGLSTLLRRSSSASAIRGSSSIGMGAPAASCSLMCQHRDSLAEFLRGLSRDARQKLGEMRNEEATIDTEAAPALVLCPVILSPVYRYHPHWQWLVASMGVNPGRRVDVTGGAGGAFAVMHAPVLLVGERGMQFTAPKPFDEAFIRDLVERKVVVPLTSDYSEFMPPEPLLQSLNIVDADFAEFMHFLKQLYDHATAWRQCIEKSCEYCLVFEDDVILSRNWIRRVVEGVAYAQTHEPDWGVLKLFEIDSSIHDQEVEGWEIEYLPFIIALSALGGLTAYAIIMSCIWGVDARGNGVHNPFLAPRPASARYSALSALLSSSPEARQCYVLALVLAALWIVLVFVLFPKNPDLQKIQLHGFDVAVGHRLLAFVVAPVLGWNFAQLWGKRSLWLALAIAVWTMILILALGQRFVLKDPYDHLEARLSDYTTVRRSLIAHRGAVANLYRTRDLPALVEHVRTMSRDLGKAGEVSADAVRADVFINAHLKELNRPVLILEPNVVQHVGFITSEPNHGYRVALSSTFEEGKLF